MKKLLCVMLLPLGLAACGESGEQEVQQWMDKTKLETKPSIAKLKEPKEFIPFVYDKKDEIDPFNPVKLQSALAKLNPGNGHGIKPDLDRRREALESMPLDTLKMVGTLTQGANHYALLLVDSKSIYQVKAGNYVGQNFGLVTKVNDDSIEIKEIYLDSGGDWAERVQKLELQEAKK
ncbi:pilus assembly protein PilP [Solimicrobium silvestre]|uniref:Tfp pilus assembly protein PilP n=1 Tax=Solimicrobium silvestre TaxID=2099400 RepID=A0A2S9H471_9BURK|nr:pilus assembly protein PilP [Solimicrobium silvestre]PRC94782.1 Tfp pilus assembly protein PilP [Solimicrobium silvestre]